MPTIFSRFLSSKQIVNHDLTSGFKRKKRKHDDADIEQFDNEMEQNHVNSCRKK
jgi:hypothetical protein